MIFPSQNLFRAMLLSLGLLCSTCACLAQQDADTHLTVDPASPIYNQSVFLHGYAHGYELGFHSGDLDLHMARVARNPKDLKMYKDGKKAYRDGFGNRDTFKRGYENGFRVGYADAFFGRDFRAAQELRTLSQQLEDQQPHIEAAADKKAAIEFDRGVSEGYKKGLSNGINDARVANQYRPEDSDCPRDQNAATFCSAHRLGYELGYSDGYNNQRKPEEGVKTASD